MCPLPSQPLAGPAGCINVQMKELLFICERASKPASEQASTVLSPLSPFHLPSPQNPSTALGRAGGLRGGSCSFIKVRGGRPQPSPRRTPQGVLAGPGHFTKALPSHSHPLTSVPATHLPIAGRSFQGRGRVLSLPLSDWKGKVEMVSSWRGLVNPSPSPCSRGTSEMAPLITPSRQVLPFPAAVLPLATPPPSQGWRPW